VQSLYRLSGGNVLRLTTARWYTPVGRSINKEAEARYHPEGGGALALSGQFVTGPDLEGRPEYTSVGGRRLYGGGGIAPDVFVVPETLADVEERAVRALYRQNEAMSVAVFNYAVGYVQEHPGLEPGFELDDDALSAFYRGLPRWDVTVDRDDFRAARRFIVYQLEREIALQAWGDEGQFLQERRFDSALGEAVELLRGAESQADLLRVAAAQPPAGP
jgi:carboxyl-terminal processing protease